MPLYTVVTYVWQFTIGVSMMWWYEYWNAFTDSCALRMAAYSWCVNEAVVRVLGCLSSQLSYVWEVNNGASMMWWYLYEYWDAFIHS
jgi:hypothetical protein